MRLVLLTIATANEPWAKAAEDLYAKKISVFSKFEHIQLKPSKNPRSEADKKVKEDSDLLLGQIKADDFILLFDEKGESFSSEAFAKQIENTMNGGKKRLVFVIGGAFGVSQQLKSRADVTVSLSNMVMNHLVAQTAALEQIYRGFTIIKNLPYHNA